MPEELLNEVEAGLAILWLERYLGRDWIREVVEVWRQRTERRRYVYPLLPHENVIANLFGLLRVVWWSQPPSSPWEQRELARLVTIAVNVRHVATRLKEDDAKRLAAILRNRRLVRGYLFQCAIAAHYMRDRYEIREFSLGEEAANDLLVADGEQAVEFQSKALQLGAGRRVPPNSFAAMARPVLEWVDRHDWRGVIRLVCDSRLNDSDAVRLSKRLIANLEDPARFAADIPGFSVDLDARSANVPVDEVNVLISPDPERPLARPTVAMIGNRDEVGLRFVLRASSRLDDRVIGKMLHEAVTAAQQLRGDVPGVVAVHTPEPVNWSLVQEAGVLDRHVSNVIATGNLDAASAIVFTSEDEHEAAYVYKNLRCQRTLSPGFRVFGADSPNADGGSKK